MNFKLYLLGFIVVFGAFDTMAQSKSKKKLTKTKEKSEINLKEKLWYGGSLNLQLAPTSLANGVDGNVFYLGLSPMIGYKFTESFSAGPRLSLDYVYGRFSLSNEILKYRAADFSFGLFTRYKFLKVLFLHGEFDRGSITGATGAILANNKLETITEWRNNLFAGLGYNSGQILSYEFYLMYDFLAKNNTTQLPISYRIGFTYNF